MKNYFETIKDRWIESAGSVNRSGKKNESEINHNELGLCWAWTIVLRDMGHEASIVSIRKLNSDISVIPRLCLDGKNIDLLSVMEKW